MISSSVASGKEKERTEEHNEEKEENEEDEGKEEGDETDEGKMEEERRNEGKVKWEVYKAYLASLGGLWIIAAIIMGYILSSTGDTLIYIWMADWTTGIGEGKGDDANLSYFLSVYVGIILVVCVIVLIRSFLEAFAIINASRTLHSKLLHSGSLPSLSSTNLKEVLISFCQ
jgi:hypothetical protein